MRRSLVLHYSKAKNVAIAKAAPEGVGDTWTWTWTALSTSYIERQNLTMRMHMRRFTRLTNAFSEKFENHAHMVALYAVRYNFVRVRKTLRVSPAMAANVSDQFWSVEDVAGMSKRSMPSLRRSAGRIRRL